MAYAILGTPVPQFLDSSGAPYVGGTITIQDPTTDATKASYPTADDADAGTNGTAGAISLDAEGKPDATQLWGRDGEDYKISVRDSGAAIVDTIEDIRLPAHSRRATVTFSSGDATPTVAESSHFITAGTTAITDFDDGQVGDTIHILGASSITITDNSAIKLLGSKNFNMVSNDTLTLTMFNDQVWEEVGRQVGAASSVASTTTTTVLPAQNGTTFYLNSATGFVTTLPTPFLGAKYTFIVSTAPTSGAHTVVTASSANILSGVLLDIVGELVYATAQDVVTFVASTSVIGDRLDVESDGTNWYYKVFSGADGGVTTGQT